MLVLVEENLLKLTHVSPCKQSNGNWAGQAFGLLGILGSPCLHAANGHLQLILLRRNAAAMATARLGLLRLLSAAAAGGSP